eukprot:comp22153_c0_seq2/m.51929 comp22153_c0_seq2/g.51929  ORF comp22153_c0_seq2/g.51929 comp22153_c0_seq2/m.51929 type:complete len:649 (+) comp22153_c0_seq2:143-2089(+)
MNDRRLVFLVAVGKDLNAPGEDKGLAVDALLDRGLVCAQLGVVAERKDLDHIVDVGGLERRVLFRDCGLAEGHGRARELNVHGHIVDLGDLLCNARRKGRDVREPMDRALQGGADKVALGLEGLLELGDVGGVVCTGLALERRMVKGVEDLDRVRGLEMGLFAELLDAVVELARKTFGDEIVVAGDVENDDNVAVNTGLDVGVGVGAGKADLDRHVLEGEGVAEHGERAGLDKLRDLCVGEGVAGLLDGLHVLAETLAEGAEVEGDGARKRRVAGLVLCAAHIELGLDVLVERLEGIEDGLVLADDGDADDGLLEGDIAALAGRAAEQDHGLQVLDGELDLLVEELCARGRVVEEMDGCLALGVALWEQILDVLVHCFDDERGERGHGDAHGEEDLEEHGERLKGVGDLAIARCLEAGSVEAHVPVCEGLDVLDEGRNHGVEAIGLHLLLDKGDERLRGGENPAVHDVCELVETGALGHKVLARALLVDVHRGDKEAVGILPGEKDVLEAVAHTFLLEAQVLSAHDGGVDEVHAESIGTILVDDLGRVRVVLEALAHLFAVGGKDKTVDDEVLERRLVVECGGEHHEGVEPAAGLVDAFGNKVGREALVELFLGLGEGEVDLRIGHGAGLEPAVKDLGGAAEHTLALA